MPSSGTGVRSSVVLACVLAGALTLCGCDKSGSATAGSPNPTKSRSPSAQPQSEPLSPLLTSYEKVLAQVVDDDGLVRYAALDDAALRKQLDEVVAGFAAEKLPSETDATARKALWLNAINTNALSMAYAASRKDGFTNVNDVPGFFTEMPITVAGEATSLEGLRTKLRDLKDPRVHAAIVVGTGTSPSLRKECYVADRLDAQLNDQSKMWFDNRGQNRTTRRELLLSPIFETYGVDFKVQPYGDVMAFVTKHARPGGSLRDFIRGVGGNPPIKYMPYDWSLNNTREATTLPAAP